MPTVRANRTNELLGFSSRSIPRRTRPVPIARVVPIPTRITAAVRTRGRVFTVRPYTRPRLHLLPEAHHAPPVSDLSGVAQAGARVQAGGLEPPVRGLRLRIHQS